jgi:hypothetical protein
MVSNTECPLGCVGGLTRCSVFHSSTHFTTHTAPRKSALLKRLRTIASSVSWGLPNCLNLEDTTTLGRPKWNATEALSGNYESYLVKAQGGGAYSIPSVVL